MAKMWRRPVASTTLVAVPLLLALLSGCGSAAAPNPTGPGGTQPIGGNRSRPGTVFIRGTVESVAHSYFVYASPTKGTFTAVTSSLTTYSVHHLPASRTSLVIGSHVGVHGYLHGSHITAVRVTFYPSKHPPKPKEKTYRGTVVATGKSWVEAQVGLAVYRFYLVADAPVIYRFLPTALTAAKKGQRVDVRAYLAGSRYEATRVQLLVQKAHHPRTITEYGIVTGSTSSGFILRTVTGAALTVIYTGHVAVSGELSVHGWPVSGGFHASKIYVRKSLPVHTRLVRGFVTAVPSKQLVVTVGSAPTTFIVEPFTHVTAALTAPEHSLRKGLYVSVRFWRQGYSRIATSIHIYKSIPIPPATGEVKGTLTAISGDTVTVGAGAAAISVEVTSLAKVRDGSHKATFAAMTRGQTISIRYYVQSGRKVATSVHIYVVAAHLKTRTGTILSIGKGSFQIVDRGIQLTVNLTPTTHIADSGNIVSLGVLKPGMRVRITGVLTSASAITAHRVDVLVLTLTKTGHLPQSFHGAVSLVSASQIVVTLTDGAKIASAITAQTKALVHNLPVPVAWLFPGPTATVSVSPGPNNSLQATQVVFHPTTRTLTGNIRSIVGHTPVTASMQLAARTQTVPVDLAVAVVSYDGSPGSLSDLQVGLKAAVDGFVLPDGVWIALKVAITHPAVRMSGIVTASAGGLVSIRRTSGEVVSLHFPAGMTALDAKTGQAFPPDRIPVGGKLSVHGIQEAGWVEVTTATLTLTSTLYHGTVLSIQSSLSYFTVQLTTGESVDLYTFSGTKYRMGKGNDVFSDVEVGDTLSFRAYPDAGGGILASSIDIQRKLLQRTGYVSDLTSTSLILVLRDSSTLQINLLPSTQVISSGQVVSLQDLEVGLKVKVEGHLRPDRNVDATKITIEG